MAGNRMRRMGKELADIKADVHSKITVEPIGGLDDITNLRGSFPGPPGTPYEGGTFHINITIPTDYPFRPPVMKFETKVWHPNISSQTGAICLDTLASAWSPVLTVRSALLSLQSLLSTPEPKDPQDAEVANMLLHHPEDFQRVAREWAIRYAGAPSDGPGDKRDPGVETLSRDQFNLLRYDGYDQHLVDRFCNMGFDVEKVVSAFQKAGVSRSAGVGDALEDAQVNDITAHLLGEA
ncbi:hypothetical protein N7492_000262 [Penicillium capsulatum]|uniref:Ubiquitin-conjugating enzyme E2 1 n=1 Tax=Penicillium capsulatum TaxID=69766 RepID=A0A9W9ISF1_9EURO|nr:hypothetical protein N7492_000262 [Penicillium capsulatum]KAJ6130672.1 hypothetical protein N7512_003452 [Penicillium capsulatum]